MKLAGDHTQRFAHRWLLTTATNCLADLIALVRRGGGPAVVGRAVMSRAPSPAVRCRRCCRYSAASKYAAPAAAALLGMLPRILAPP